jgi:tRNA pseudouridine55 synthase
VIDKAEGWTSHDVVAKFRGIAKTRRVGHLGTLDPMATGVLPLAVGVATRLARFYTRAEKIYEGGVRFGFATDTYDRTGAALGAAAGESVPVTFSAQELEQALASFRGTILQMPPQYSAKKVGGVTAYKAARNNITVELQPVEIQIHELTLLQFDGSRADLRIRCSGGTYIRSIAHDLGQLLGCGAHLDSLRRFASGEFTLAHAHSLENIDISAALIPLEALVPQFPTIVAGEELAGYIRQGRVFQAAGFEAEHVKAVTESGQLLAICDRAGVELYHPSLVLSTL